MLKYLLGLLLSAGLFAQNTDPTCFIVGIQRQSFATGASLSIPLHRFGIATSGLHMDAVLKNKKADDLYTDKLSPVHESYSLGYYVDYGRTFVSFGYNYYNETRYTPIPDTFRMNTFENPKHGGYLKLGIHGKYLGVFAGYSSASKASAGILLYIPFRERGKSIWR